MTKQAYAFVLPRYFRGIAGGAETLSSNLAFKLAEASHKVEIFTTCAKDNRSWENFYKPESFKESGVTVNRYPVDKRNLDSWIPKQISISQGMKLSVDDQLEWMKEGVNSSALYTELVRRQAEFDYIFFAPYLFATTFWGSQLVPEKAVLIPCLHDENYAYLEVTKAMFEGVQGALFNAVPEQAQAEKLYGKIAGSEVGMGFEEFSEEYINSLAKPDGIDGPYILYLGRKETGKNVHLLIDYFVEAKDIYGLDSNLKLVIAGGGSFKDLHRDAAFERKDIIDIDHLPEESKHALIKNAAIFCQPSVNESFSIVIMEAWLLGVPSLVHSDCAVTAYHAEKSGGGMYFSDSAEFFETVSALINNNQLSVEMAKAGCQYVKKVYSWDAVIERFYSALEKIRTKGCQADNSLTFL